MKLEELIKKCKCGVYLTVNEHRDVYQSVEERIDEINCIDENTINDELKKRLIKANCIYELQFYPYTPIGFYVAYGESLEEVLREAEKAFQINLIN